MLTYADYVNQKRKGAAGAGSSESGAGASDVYIMPESEWNAQDGRSKWDSVGGLLDVNPGDAQYEELKQAILAKNPDADVRSISLSSQHGGKDPSKSIQLPDGSYAWSVDNSTQPQHALRDALLGIASVLGVAGIGSLVGLGAEGSGAFAGATAGGSTGVDFLGNMIDPSILGSSGELPAMSGSPFDLTPATGGGGVGPQPLSGGDYPYGTEMPNTYAPDARPTDFFGVGDTYYTPGLASSLNEPSFFDRLLSGASSALPALSAASKFLTPHAASGVGGLGAGGGGISVGSGAPRSTAGKVDTEQNPYLKMKVKPAGSLIEYLRGQ